MENEERISLEEFEFLVEETAYRKGLSKAIVEKDYWVCWMLNYLFNKSYLQHSIAFKGGTSLSKGYRLIERFSEDIDIILDWRVLGYRQDEPWFERSNTKQDEFIKEVNYRTEEYLRNILVPKLNEDIQKELGYEYKCFIEDNDNQVVTFQYKKLFKSDYVIPYVRLEIGALARMSDLEQIVVESYIGEVNRYLFNKQKSYIIAVNPIRTFWEKITILHREAYRPIDKKCPERYSRHYYDVYCLSKSNLQLFDANSKYLLDQVVNFKETFYRCPWARYDLAKVGSLKLIPPNYNINFFREDYEKMKEMIYGEKPSFDEILDSLKELEIKINSLENYKKNMWRGVDKIKDKQDDGYEMGD